MCVGGGGGGSPGCSKLDISYRKDNVGPTKGEALSAHTLICLSHTLIGKFSDVCTKSGSGTVCFGFLTYERFSFCLFDLILYVSSTIFQLNRDGSSWIEPVLSWDKCVLLKDHNAVTPVRLEPPGGVL